MDSGEFVFKQFMISNMQEKFEFSKTPDGGWLAQSNWKISDSQIEFDTKVRYSESLEPLGLFSQQDVRGRDQEVGVMIDGASVKFWRVRNGQREEQTVETTAPLIILDSNQAMYHYVLYEKVKDLNIGQTRTFAALAPQVMNAYNIVVQREPSTNVYRNLAAIEADLYSLNYEGGISMNMYVIDGVYAGTVEPISTTYHYRDDKFADGFSLEPPPED